jgi:hypothetical protein
MDGDTTVTLCQPTNEPVLSLSQPSSTQSRQIKDGSMHRRIATKIDSKHSTLLDLRKAAMIQ